MYGYEGSRLWRYLAAVRYTQTFREGAISPLRQIIVYPLLFTALLAIADTVRIIADVTLRGTLKLLARLFTLFFRTLEPRGACSDACQVYSCSSGGSECSAALVVFLLIVRVVLALLVLLALGARLRVL